MDLLDRFLGHDHWTTKQLLTIAATLSDEQLDRPFDIGHQTIRQTFCHIIRNMEVWSALLCDEQPPSEQSATPSIESLQARLDIAAGMLRKAAMLAKKRDDWDATWIDLIDGKEKTYGAAIAHIVTHSMHHRAQLLYMLRLAGLNDLPEGDVFSWETSVRG